MPVGCVNAFTQLRVFTVKRPEPLAALPVRLGSHGRHRAGYVEALTMAGLPEWWVSRSGGAPGTLSAWETPPTASTRCRLLLSGGFTVIDREQRRLHHRAHTLGFPDLHSYLVARCQHDASLAQLADELDTTIDVVRRLLDQAGIQRSPRPVRSARRRRRTTDQGLTKRATQLGFASLQAYLADRVTQQAWPLTQIADELGVDRDTVRDRLDRFGLRRTRQTGR
jgi:hypothetical protein